MKHRSIITLSAAALAIGLATAATAQTQDWHRGNGQARTTTPAPATTVRPQATVRTQAVPQIQVQPPAQRYFRGNAGGGAGGWQQRPLQAATPAPTVPQPQTAAQPYFRGNAGGGAGGWHQRQGQWQGQGQGQRLSQPPVAAQYQAPVQRGWQGGNQAQHGWNGAQAGGQRWQGGQPRTVDRSQWRGGPGQPGSYRGPRGNYQAWNRGWQNDERYDWHGWRDQNRAAYHLGAYYAPYDEFYYSPLSIGFDLDPAFFGDDYWIDDPWTYHLPEAEAPYRWVRYYNDVVLVDTYSGQVVDVIYNFFW